MWAYYNWSVWVGMIVAVVAFISIIVIQHRTVKYWMNKATLADDFVQYTGMLMIERFRTTGNDSVMYNQEYVREMLDQYVLKVKTSKGRHFLMLVPVDDLSMLSLEDQEKIRMMMERGSAYHFTKRGDHDEKK